MISEPFIVLYNAFTAAVMCMCIYLYTRIKDSYKFLSCAMLARHFIDKSRNMVHMQYTAQCSMLTFESWTVTKAITASIVVIVTNGCAYYNIDALARFSSAIPKYIPYVRCAFFCCFRIVIEERKISHRIYYFPLQTPTHMFAIRNICVCVQSFLIT